MKIKGFYHIYAINHWYSVVESQMRILLTSGLYDACEEINIGIIGLPEERVYFQVHFIEPYPKLKLRVSSMEPTDYEFNTLRLIENDKSDYVGFYFHAKGVTKPFDTMVNHWRAYLNEEILNKFQEHRDRVENGFDVSSVNFLKSPDHFSGNFYWFNRRYIDRLPKIDKLDHSNRWAAEQYIAMGKGKFYYPPFHEPGQTIINIKYKP